MVFRVVSAITQQFGHSVMCVSSFARISASRFSSRKSLSSRRKSLQVSKGVVSLAFENSRQLLAELQAGAEKAAFYRRDRKPEGLGRLFRREVFDIAEDENRTV